MSDTKESNETSSHSSSEEEQKPKITKKTVAKKKGPIKKGGKNTVAAKKKVTTKKTNKSVNSDNSESSEDKDDNEAVEVPPLDVDSDEEQNCKVGREQTTTTGKFKHREPIVLPEKDDINKKQTLNDTSCDELLVYAWHKYGCREIIKTLRSIGDKEANPSVAGAMNDLLYSIHNRGKVRPRGNTFRGRGRSNRGRGSRENSREPPQRGYRGNSREPPYQRGNSREPPYQRGNSREPPQERGRQKTRADNYKNGTSKTNDDWSPNNNDEQVYDDE
jgi:hypothetical protein